MRDIKAIFDQQKNNFYSMDNSLAARIERLKILKKAIFNHEQAILEALAEDLGKSESFARSTEIDRVVAEIDFAVNNLEIWMEPEPISLSEELPSKSCFINREPFGVVYVIGPFNYPLNLTLIPVVGALAAGNTVFVKPANSTPETAKVIEKIINNNFPEEIAYCVRGDRSVGAQLQELPFDLIFFTGSPNVGSQIMQSAAKSLTPVILELGGKSPAIILEDANLDKAIERITKGKLANSGQTCVAPDYVYVDKKISEQVINRFVAEFSKYSELGVIGKLVTSSKVEELANMVNAVPEKLIFGGKYDTQKRYFQPTILKDVNWQDEIMKDEIFGPVLPILTFNSENEIAKTINQYHPNPLGVYVFSEKIDKAEELVNQIPAGDAEINDAYKHVTSLDIPFGGKGKSGMGEYHGKFSFEAFTHRKSVRIAN